MRYEDLDTFADLDQSVDLVPVEEVASTRPVAQTGTWTVSMRVTSVLACAALMSVLSVQGVESTRGALDAAVVSRAAEVPPRLSGEHVRAATAARQFFVVVPEEAPGEDPDHGF